MLAVFLCVFTLLLSSCDQLADLAGFNLTEEPGLVPSEPESEEPISTDVVVANSPNIKEKFGVDKEGTDAVTRIFETLDKLIDEGGLDTGKIKLGDYIDWRGAERSWRIATCGGSASAGGHAAGRNPGKPGFRRSRKCAQTRF
jgi:hypothetical protein